jgi:peroxiredoxin family protein
MTLMLERPTELPIPATLTTSEKKTGGLVIFAWSGDLDRVWPTLILANTAAAAGKPVTVFFTFWGLFPLVRNDRGITGIGPAMMKTLAKHYKVASPQELLETAIDMGVKLVPCQMTMDLMGLTKDDLIEGIEEPAGATSALAAAEGATTLFI